VPYVDATTALDDASRRFGDMDEAVRHVQTAARICDLCGDSEHVTMQPLLTRIVKVFRDGCDAVSQLPTTLRFALDEVTLREAVQDLDRSAHAVARAATSVAFPDALGDPLELRDTTKVAILVGLAALRDAIVAAFHATAQGNAPPNEVGSLATVQQGVRHLEAIAADRALGAALSSGLGRVSGGKTSTLSEFLCDPFRTAVRALDAADLLDAFVSKGPVALATTAVAQLKAKGCAMRVLSTCETEVCEATRRTAKRIRELAEECHAQYKEEVTKDHKAAAENTDSWFAEQHDSDSDAEDAMSMGSTVVTTDSSAGVARVSRLTTASELLHIIAACVALISCVCDWIPAQHSTDTPSLRASGSSGLRRTSRPCTPRGSPRTTPDGSRNSTIMGDATKEVASLRERIEKLFDSALKHSRDLAKTSLKWPMSSLSTSAAPAATAWRLAFFTRFFYSGRSRTPTPTWTACSSVIRRR
jgi:hypothetical protein